jgi:hypothetical protein
MRLARVLARFTPVRRGADLPWVRTAYRLLVAKKWAVSSAVEHCFHTAGATGSIPVPPTNNQALTKLFLCLYGKNTEKYRAIFGPFANGSASSFHGMFERRGET